MINIIDYGAGNLRSVRKGVRTFWGLTQKYLLTPKKF